MGVYEHDRRCRTLKRNRGRLRGGLRPHLLKTGLRPEPDLEQLESAKQIDWGGYLGGGDYLESYVRGTYLLFNLRISLFSNNFIENYVTQDTFDY